MNDDILRWGGKNCFALFEEEEAEDRDWGCKIVTKSIIKWKNWSLVEVDRYGKLSTGQKNWFKT